MTLLLYITLAGRLYIKCMRLLLYIISDQICESVYLTCITWIPILHNSVILGVTLTIDSPVVQLTLMYPFHLSLHPLPLCLFLPPLLLTLLPPFLSSPPPPLPCRLPPPLRFRPSQPALRCHGGNTSGVGPLPGGRQVAQGKVRNMLIQI